MTIPINTRIIKVNNLAEFPYRVRCQSTLVKRLFNLVPLHQFSIYALRSSDLLNEDYTRLHNLQLIAEKRLSSLTATIGKPVSWLPFSRREFEVLRLGFFSELNENLYKSIRRNHKQNRCITSAFWNTQVPNGDLDMLMKTEKKLKILKFKNWISREPF